MSLSGKYVSLARVIENVNNNFRFKGDFDWQDAAEWIASLLALLEVPAALEMKTTDGNSDLNNPEPIEIVDGKGKLPCDMYKIIQTAAVAGEYCDQPCNVSLIPMKYSTNTFHQLYHCDSSDFYCVSELTYQLNKNYIFTSFPVGKVYMSYLAIPTDEEGMPMIPDHESWIKACEYEIMYKLAIRAYLNDELTMDKFQFVERERDWYVAQAVNATKNMSLDEWESFKNMVVRSIPKINFHQGFFKNMNTQEVRYNHPFRREISSFNLKNI